MCLELVSEVLLLEGPFEFKIEVLSYFIPEVVEIDMSLSLESPVFNLEKVVREELEDFNDEMMFDYEASI